MFLMLYSFCPLTVLSPKDLPTSSEMNLIKQQFPQNLAQQVFSFINEKLDDVAYKYNIKNNNKNNSNINKNNNIDNNDYNNNNNYNNTFIYFRTVAHSTMLIYGAVQFTRGLSTPAFYNGQALIIRTFAMFTLPGRAQAMKSINYLLF